MKNSIKDNIDKRIERVVRSVATKKELMAIWNTEKEKRNSQNRQIRKFAVKAAASIVIIVGVGMGVMIFYWKEPGPASQLTYEYSAKQLSSDYSSESFDIETVESLLESERYEDALEEIEAIMADTIIDPMLPLENKKRIRILLEDRAYELEWIKIRTLIMLDRKNDAVDLLNLYVEKAGPNQYLAKQLQKDLNNK